MSVPIVSSTSARQVRDNSSSSSTHVDAASLPPGRRTRIRSKSAVSYRVNSGMTKFAVAGMSEAVAIEIGTRGVGVSVVNPGPVDTEFFEARGHPYARSTPKPVSAERVAKDVIAAVEKNKMETYIPRWLGPAVVSRVLLPPLYRSGTTRAFKKELSKP